MKRCTICKQEKMLGLFGKNKTKKDGLQTYCKDCSRGKDRRHYSDSSYRKISVKNRRTEQQNDNTRFLYEFLKSSECVDCGESDVACLDFDHVKGNKINGVKRMKSYSMSTLLNEISKCEVRCSNCHRKRHAKEKNWYSNI
jgi:hypothetical protein